MPKVEKRIADLGLSLPREPTVPPHVRLPFTWVRVRGERALLSGHGALTADGAPRGPFGPVPSQVSLELAQDSAREATLSMLAGLKRAIGDLDRVAAWLSLSVLVNADPGYEWTTLVANAASELLVDVFGVNIGAHSRTAPGVTALPFNLPVIVAGEAELDPSL